MLITVHILFPVCSVCWITLARTAVMLCRTRWSNGSHPKPKTCGDGCIAAGHCCTGLESSWQHPSCAMGCALGRESATIDACVAECHAADNKCAWTISNLTGNNCGSCASGCSAADGVGECVLGCELAFGQDMRQEKPITTRSLSPPPPRCPSRTMLQLVC